MAWRRPSHVRSRAGGEGALPWFDLVDRARPAGRGFQAPRGRDRRTGRPDAPTRAAAPSLPRSAFVGKAPGKYNMYLGAAFNGSRLNSLYKASVAAADIVAPCPAPPEALRDGTGVAGRARAVRRLHTVRSGIVKPTGRCGRFPRQAGGGAHRAAGLKRAGRRNVRRARKRAALTRGGPFCLSAFDPVTYPK